MQKMPQDFRKAPDRVILKKLVDYLYQNLPLTFYQLHVQMLVSQLGVQEAMETLEEDEEARDCGFRRVTTSVAPILDATEMQEKLHPTPPSVAGPRGDLTPKRTLRMWIWQWGDQLCLRMDQSSLNTHQLIQ